MQLTRLTLFASCVLGSHSYLYAQLPQNFISAPPCRIADTRNPSGAFGGPALSAHEFPSFPIPASACAIPPNASAYSLNVTVVPFGPLGFLSLLPTPATPPTATPNFSTLNDPLGTVVANAAIVPAGVNGAVTVFASDATQVIIDIDGYFLDQTSLNLFSTSLGTGALSQNTGQYNTATGFESLSFPSGSFNTANGAFALNLNTTGRENTGLGYNTLAQNQTGFQNTAIGSGAMEFNTDGFQSTAVGSNVLNVASGSQNTGVGDNALDSVTSGGGNVGLGYLSGFNITTGSNNIEIGNFGANSDNNTILIGTQGVQTSTSIAGIFGSTVTGSAVLVNASGRLGVQSSSIRYKEDVRDMADQSDALMKLHPVAFRYKQRDEDGTRPLQFGLVAEEVAEVYPELVVRGKDGAVDTVQYHQLPAMLLNELQKQHHTIEQLQKEIEDLRSRVGEK